MGKNKFTPKNDGALEIKKQKMKKKKKPNQNKGKEKQKLMKHDVQKHLNSKTLTSQDASEVVEEEEIEPEKIQDNEVSSTTVDLDMKTSTVTDNAQQPGPQEEMLKFSSFAALIDNYKPHTKPLIKTSAEWHTQLLIEDKEGPSVDYITKNKLKELAKKIHQNDVEVFNKMEESGSKKKDVKFRKMVLYSGTTRDKLAAHVLRCMEAPVHSLNHLNSLIPMVTPKASTGYDEAFSSITELLETTYLPKARIARKFENHKFHILCPLIASNQELVEKQLALWYFEDQLAFTYQKLVGHLTQISHDTVENNKLKGIKSMTILLDNNPAQDADVLLESLVNKLGDPMRRVVSQTIHLLNNLMKRRPVLKNKVVTLTEIVLYRTNITEKAQYYCLCMLSEIMFQKDEKYLANKLLKLYFGFFKACTKKGEVDTRLMSALLRGIKRAHPFTGKTSTELEGHLNMLYKMVHLVNFGIGTQALTLVFQVLTGQGSIADRFYRTLYYKLLDKAFGNSSVSSAFLNLVFKALLWDESLSRILAFIKRLLQVGEYQESHMACGILYLVAEVIREKPGLRRSAMSMLKSSVPAEENTRLTKDTRGSDSEEEENENEEKDIKPRTSKGYDPHHRNPMYCGAEFTSLWELHLLKNHFHPSVELFANKILSNKDIGYSGNPVLDFTLMRFLDRFVYRNPKNIKNKDGSVYVPHGARNLEVNTKEFQTLDPSNVPEDEKFFYKYFTEIKNTKKPEKDDEESPDGDDVEFDDFLNQMSGVGNDQDDSGDELDFAAGATGKARDFDDEEMSDEEEMGDEEDGDFPDEAIGEDGDEDMDEDEADLLKTLSEDEEEEHLDGEDSDGFDFDEEGVAFSDEDDFPSSKLAKKTGKKSSKKADKLEDLSSMFADAEDFAHLLEDNDDGMDGITSQAVLNRDRAHAKQLKWEKGRGINKQKKGPGGGKRGGFKAGGAKRGGFKAGGSKQGGFKASQKKPKFKAKKGGGKPFKGKKK